MFSRADRFYVYPTLHRWRKISSDGPGDLFSLCLLLGIALKEARCTGLISSKTEQADSCSSTLEIPFPTRLFPQPRSLCYYIVELMLPAFLSNFLTNMWVWRTQGPALPAFFVVPSVGPLRHVSLQDNNGWGNCIIFWSSVIKSPCMATI